MFYATGVRNYSKNYHSKPRKKSFRRRINWQSILKIAYFLFFSGIMGGLVYFFVFSQFFKVNEIIVKGNRHIAAASLIEISDNFLMSPKFLFLKNDNINFIDVKDIGQKIQNEFYRIDSISIKKNYPNKLVLNVKEREVAEILCSGEEAGSDYFNCFLIDKNGLAFEKAADSKGFLILRILDKRGTKIEIGQKVLNTELIEFTKQITNNFKKAANYNIKLLVLEHPAQRELSVLIDDWKIIFDVAGDPEKQLLVLKEVLEKEVKENMANLDYIDLRVEGRAYYKMNQ